MKRLRNLDLPEPLAPSTSECLAKSRVWRWRYELFVWYGKVSALNRADAWVSSRNGKIFWASRYFGTDLYIK